MSACCGEGIPSCKRVFDRRTADSELRRFGAAGFANVAHRDGRVWRVETWERVAPIAGGRVMIDGTLAAP